MRKVISFLTVCFIWVAAASFTWAGPRLPSLKKVAGAVKVRVPAVSVRVPAVAKPAVSVATHVNPAQITKQIQKTVQHIQPLLTASQIQLPPRHPLSPDFKLTHDEVGEFFSEFWDNKKAASSSTDLTPEQNARVKEAADFFDSVVTKDFYDLRFWMHPLTRRHAAVLRSPRATQYAYYIQGSSLEEAQKMILQTMKGGIQADAGYIPNFVGEPIWGTTPQEIYEMFAHAPKTDKPILVHFNGHGGANKRTGKFETEIGKKRVSNDYERFKMSTEEIARMLQSLRQQTQAPEINVAAVFCHGGLFFNEFVQLPAELREGINLFVESSVHQYTVIDEATLWAHSLEPGETIKMRQIINLFRQLARGNIFVQAYVDGQVFNPLQEFYQYALTSPEGQTELTGITETAKLVEVAEYLFWIQNDPAKPEERFLLPEEVEQLKNEANSFWIGKIALIAAKQAHQRFGVEFDQALQKAKIFIKKPNKITP